MSIIGIGTDIIEIERLKKAMQTRPKFGGRVFTANELAYCYAKGNVFQSLAARFAAKEAVSKALGSGIEGFGWQDIEVINNAQGKPEVKLYNQALMEANRRGLERIEISLSHCQQYALAMVILWGGRDNCF